MLWDSCAIISCSLSSLCAVLSMLCRFGLHMSAGADVMLILKLVVILAIFVEFMAVVDVNCQLAGENAIMSVCGGFWLLCESEVLCGDWI